jgi:hypothetical protein
MLKKKPSTGSGMLWQALITTFHAWSTMRRRAGCNVMLRLLMRCSHLSQLDPHRACVARRVLGRLAPRPAQPRAPHVPPSADLERAHRAARLSAGCAAFTTRAPTLAAGAAAAEMADDITYLCA